MFNASKRSASVLPALIVPTFLALLVSTGHGNSDCSVVHAGLDTSYAMGSENSIAMGEAMGETFFAQDTVIQAVTVWRPGFAGWEGLQLFVLGTDSTGTPQTSKMLLVGPAVYNPVVDSTHYVPVRFDLDPPLVLPSKGIYEVATLGAPCDANVYVAINTTDAFPFGKFWMHYRSAISGCRVRSVRVGVDSYDMIFDIEYCEPATPTLPSTWGAVRARYR